MATTAKVPDVHLMPVFTGKQKVGLESAFDHVWRAPLAGQQRVESQMPPKIIMQELWASIHLPLTQDLERLTIQHENAPWAIAIGRSNRANVNTFRSTVNRVWTRIISARKNFLGLDHLH